MINLNYDIIFISRIIKGSDVLESVKDYLDRLEINNNILNKQLKDVYVSKVVYFKEDKIVYFHLTSKSIINYEILDSLKEELKPKLSYFKNIKIPYSKIININYYIY